MVKPIRTFRDGGLSIAVFETEEQDKKSYSFKVQKSYKKDDEWVNKELYLFKDDLLKLKELLDVSYKNILIKKE